jgi:hypothetical protein
MGLRFGLSCSIRESTRILDCLPLQRAAICLQYVANYLVSLGINKTAHLVVHSETSISPAPSSTCSVVGNYWPRPPFCLMIIQTTGMPFVMTQQRKILISRTLVVSVYRYGLLLGGAFLVGTIPILKQESLTSILVMAEVGKWVYLWCTNLLLSTPLRNKYLIWAVLTCFI